MNRLTLLAAADLHGILPIYQWLVETANRRADLLVLAGDLFEGDFPEHQRERAAPILSLLQAARVPVLYLMGNDDEVELGYQDARILQARDLAPDTPVPDVASLLGSGDLVTAQDTVPFALWCSATRLHDYELALWDTVSGLGDRDTTCAMVGGIVVMLTGEGAIPPAWLRAREPLPHWGL